MSHKPLLRRPLPQAHCAYCSTPFQPYRSWQRFCPQPALCREISYLAGSRAGLRPAPRQRRPQRRQRTPMLVLSDCKTKKSRYTAVLYWCRGPWAKEPRAGVGPWRECSIWREELEPKGVEGWSSKLLCHISGSSADGSLKISASQCHWRDDAGEPRD